MCGRFYIDDDTAREIEKMIRKVDKQLRRERKTGDIHPTESATVITAEQKELIATDKKWGFPGFGHSKVIINARAESALEKKMFRDSVLNRRLIIPATGFYEWNQSKEKVTFMKNEPLYMAGFYNRFGDEDCFVILTTAANQSMREIHDRMPLILEPEEIEQWLLDDKKAKELLHKVPGLLNKKMEYEQQRLFMY